jgi:hypothetical protein
LRIRRRPTKRRYSSPAAVAAICVGQDSHRVRLVVALNLVCRLLAGCEHEIRQPDGQQPKSHVQGCFEAEKCALTEGRFSDDPAVGPQQSNRFHLLDIAHLEQGHEQRGRLEQGSDGCHHQRRQRTIRFVNLDNVRPKPSERTPAGPQYRQREQDLGAPGTTGTSAQHLHLVPLVAEGRSQL